VNVEGSGAREGTVMRPDRASNIDQKQEKGGKAVKERGVETERSARARTRVGGAETL